MGNHIQDTLRMPERFNLKQRLEMNIIRFEDTFGLNSDESTKNNVFWHKMFGTPLVLAKDPLKHPKLSHIGFVRASFLGNFFLFL